MNGVFQIGATGLHAQDRALEIVANNITNMNTPGFKRSGVHFAEMIGPRLPADPSVLGATVNGNSAGLFGVTSEQGMRVFSDGELRPTGNPLDLALRGEGFIELVGADGQVMLWRGGTLRVNEDGFLAAANGLQLKSAISVPEGATAITIDNAGEVRAVMPGESEPRSIGRIDLVLVRNLEGLTAQEGGLYRAASVEDVVAAEPGERGGNFVQGSLELSNVTLTDEMVQLMMMQRAYAASAQVVQAGDQLMGIANGLKR
jgi:flagellar basal-body rod protein FlgG